MEHKTGIITKKEKYCIFRWIIIIMRANGQLCFLGEKVTKYHRTLTTYLNTLLSNGFIINHIVEPQPPEYMIDIPGMQDEMRRPMMLIVSANKKVDR